MISRCRLPPLSLFPLLVTAQTFEREIDPFPVISGGAVLETPFLGGFNQPVPQFVDWDGDGLLDLFILDEDGKIQFYRNGGSSSDPQFQLRTKWFQELNVGRWYRFVDYDLDGYVDLLCQTSGSADISVYQNRGDILELVTIDWLQMTVTLYTEGRLSSRRLRISTLTAGRICSWERWREQYPITETLA